MAEQLWDSTAEFDAGTYTQATASNGSLQLARDPNASRSETFSWEIESAGGATPYEEAEATVEILDNDTGQTLFYESVGDLNSDSGTVTIDVGQHSNLESYAHVKDFAGVNPSLATIGPAYVETGESETGTRTDTAYRSYGDPFYPSGSWDSEGRNWSDEHSYTNLVTSSNTYGESIDVTISNEAGDSITHTLFGGSEMFDISSLQNSSSVSVDVSLSTNDSGTTPLLDSVEVQANIAAPESVTLSADAARETEIDISWNETRATSAEVLRAQSSGATATDYTTVASLGDVQSYTDTGLENGEKYYYRVKVSNTSGSSLSNEVSATTTVPNLTNTALSAGSREVTATWTTNDNSTDGDILVELMPTGGSWSEVATLAPDATEHTEAGLLDGEEYRVRVTRRTDHAASPGSTTDPATTDQPAPTDLSVGNIDAESGSLSWTASHNYGDTLVQLRRVDTTSWETVATLDRDVETYELGELLNGERYQARVLAATEHTETPDQ